MTSESRSARGLLSSRSWGRALGPAQVDSALIVLAAPAAWWRLGEGRTKGKEDKEAWAESGVKLMTCMYAQTQNSNLPNDRREAPEPTGPRRGSAAVCCRWHAKYMPDRRALRHVRR